MNDMDLLKTCIDSSYEIHKYIQSHTGGMIAIGRGAAMSKSSKRKINTKRSMKAYMVGTSN